MNWEQALDVVVEKTKQDKNRLLSLCEESNPNYLRNRSNLIVKAERLLEYDKDRSLPSLVDQAKNFAGAMVDYAKDGFKNVSQDEYDNRLSICGSCELFRHSDKRCSHPSCGCFMEKKSWLRSAKCPIGKW